MKLIHVEREPQEVNEEGTDKQFESLRTENVYAEFYNLLCQACTGDALPCIRAVDDMHGLMAWQKLYKKPH